MFSKLTTLTLALTISLVSCNTFSAAPGSPVLISPENKAKVEYEWSIEIDLTFEIDATCVLNLIEISTSPDFEPYYTVEGAGVQYINADEKITCIHPFQPFALYVTYYWRAYSCSSDGNWSEPSEVWKFTVKEL